MTSNKKVKAQIRLLLQKNNTAKTSTELFGVKNVDLHSKCLLFKFSELLN